MKLKCEIIIDEVAGQKIAIPLKQNKFNGNFMMVNSTGVYLLELLKNDISVEDILISIQKNFEVEDIKAVEKVVLGFIENLKKADLLDNGV